MSYTNSKLVDCKVMSPNHSGTRTHAIDTITPHCVVGQLVAENIGYCFDDTAREASCNYGIGTDGRVCLVVDEANRSWCTSSRDNDQRAITIECASDKSEPYAMNDRVYNKLIELCVDICKRNGKTKLLWFADKDKTLNYCPAKDEMIITVHRWFANKSCPGNWLYSRLGHLASEVTKRLGTATPTPAPTITDGKYYRIRKSWTDSASQLGAYTNLENAKKACEDGYTVYDWNGNAVYPVKVESTPNKGEATVLEFQNSAIADGFKFPLYGADGFWGDECREVAKNAIIKERIVDGEWVWKYPNLTKLAQKLLGFTRDDIDGKCGNGTGDKIEAFQRKHGLKPDRCIGLLTWEELLGV